MTKNNIRKVRDEGKKVSKKFVIVVVVDIISIIRDVDDDDDENGSGADGWMNGPKNNVHDIWW